MTLNRFTHAVAAFALGLSPMTAIGAVPDSKPTEPAAAPVATPTQTPAPNALGLPPLERLQPALDYANGTGTAPTVRRAPDAATPEESPILPPEDSGKDGPGASQGSATKLVRSPATVDGF